MTEAANETFLQYALRIEREQAAQPWHYSGCSVAYRRWAEQKDCPDQQMGRVLRFCWGWAMAMQVKPILLGDTSGIRNLPPVEQEADGVLNLLLGWLPFIGEISDNYSERLLGAPTLSAKDDLLGFFIDRLNHMPHVHKKDIHPLWHGFMHA